MFERLFIIAEAGSNHNGNLDTAVKLVYCAKDAGADAIKFQDFSLNTLFAPSYYEKRLNIEDTSWRQRIDRCAFKPGWHDVVAKAARKADIYYFSTPYSLRAVDIIDDFVPFYKISSGDITYVPLLQKIGEREKGVFISTGASRLDEIDNAVRTLEKFNPQFICIMHCIML
jgi:N-acetylneuraminate synthase